MVKLSQTPWLKKSSKSGQREYILLKRRVVVLFVVLLFLFLDVDVWFLLSSLNLLWCSFAVKGKASPWMTPPSEAAASPTTITCRVCVERNPVVLATVLVAYLCQTFVAYTLLIECVCVSCRVFVKDLQNQCWRARTHHLFSNTSKNMLTKIIVLSPHIKRVLSNKCALPSGDSSPRRLQREDSSLVAQPGFFGHAGLLETLQGLGCELARGEGFSDKPSRSFRSGGLYS